MVKHRETLQLRAMVAAADIRTLTKTAERASRGCHGGVRAKR